MSLKNAIDKLKYDSRMSEINLKSQIVTHQDLKKNLEKLPDVAANSAPLDLDSDRDDDDLGAN